MLLLFTNYSKETVKSQSIPMWLSNGIQYHCLYLSTRWYLCCSSASLPWIFPFQQWCHWVGSSGTWQYHPHLRHTLISPNGLVQSMLAMGSRCTPDGGDNHKGRIVSFHRQPNGMYYTYLSQHEPNGMSVFMPVHHRLPQPKYAIWFWGHAEVNLEWFVKAMMYP
jgi:hypothetical protein